MVPGRVRPVGVRILEDGYLDLCFNCYHYGLYCSNCEEFTSKADVALVDFDWFKQPGSYEEYVGKILNNVYVMSEGKPLKVSAQYNFLAQKRNGRPIRLAVVQVIKGII